MRDTKTLHNQVDDAEEALAEDESLTWSVKQHFHLGDLGLCKLTDASTIRGVSSQPILDLHHQLRTPPIVRARVKEGTLYIPRNICWPIFQAAWVGRANTNRLPRQCRQVYRRASGC